MPRLYSVMTSDDGLSAAERDMAAFVRAWNKSHCCVISTVDFRLMDGNGSLFPVVCRGSVSYRDIYPKGGR